MIIKTMWVYVGQLGLEVTHNPRYFIPEPGECRALCAQDAHERTMAPRTGEVPGDITHGIVIGYN